MSNKDREALQRIDAAFRRIRGAIQAISIELAEIAAAQDEINDACRQLDQGAEK